MDPNIHTRVTGDTGSAPTTLPEQKQQKQPAIPTAQETLRQASSPSVSPGRIDAAKVKLLAAATTARAFVRRTTEAAGKLFKGVVKRDTISPKSLEKPSKKQLADTKKLAEKYLENGDLASLQKGLTRLMYNFAGGNVKESEDVDSLTNQQKGDQKKCGDPSKRGLEAAKLCSALMTHLTKGEALELAKKAIDIRINSDRPEEFLRQNDMSSAMVSAFYRQMLPHLPRAIADQMLKPAQENEHTAGTPAFYIGKILNAVQTAVNESPNELKKFNQYVDQQLSESQKFQQHAQKHAPPSSYQIFFLRGVLPSFAPGGAHSCIPTLPSANVSDLSDPTKRIPDRAKAQLRQDLINANATLMKTVNNIHTGNVPTPESGTSSQISSDISEASKAQLKGIIEKSRKPLETT